MSIYFILAMLVSVEAENKRSGEGIIREEKTISIPQTMAPNQTIEFQLYQDGPKCRITIRDGVQSFTCDQVKA